jgi:hypothetical protein
VMPTGRHSAVTNIACAAINFPHQRILQLISNALYEAGLSELDIFHVTDQELTDALRDYCQKHNK